ncbi:hypothetical protein ACJD0Z_12500 [Flavobacteriaceae bacterium M23B6Z8]
MISSWIDLSKDLPEKYAYFNLEGPVWHYDSGRYTYLLIKSFHLAGYTIYINDKYSLLSRLLKYKALLLKLPFKIVKGASAPGLYAEKNTIVVGNESTLKKIRLRFHEDRLTENSDAFPMPYLMHPMMYAEAYSRQIPALRDSLSMFKILFAGNTNEKEYSRSVLKYKFNKTNRFEAIRFITEEFTEKEVIQVIDRNALTAPGIYQNKLLLVRSSLLKIPFNQWLPTLAKSDFFLACSGSRMPMCHNVVEAMAVGTVPILEYPEYFHPPLEHELNCIVYSGLSDLYLKVQEVLAMKEEEIATLKQNAISYYETYLAPEKWISDLLNASDEKTDLIVNAHLIPHKQEIPADVYTSEDSIPNLTNQKSL